MKTDPFATNQVVKQDQLLARKDIKELCKNIWNHMEKIENIQDELPINDPCYNLPNHGNIRSDKTIMKLHEIFNDLEHSH